MENTVCHVLQFTKYIIHTEKGEQNMPLQKYATWAYYLGLWLHKCWCKKEYLLYFAPLWNQEVNLPCEGIFLSTKRVEGTPITGERIQDWAGCAKFVISSLWYPKPEPLCFVRSSLTIVSLSKKHKNFLFWSCLQISYLWDSHMYENTFFFLLIWLLSFI